MLGHTCAPSISLPPPLTAHVADRNEMALGYASPILQSNRRAGTVNTFFTNSLLTTRSAYLSEHSHDLSYPIASLFTVLYRDRRGFLFHSLPV